MGNRRVLNWEQRKLCIWVMVVKALLDRKARSVGRNNIDKSAALNFQISFSNSENA